MMEFRVGTNDLNPAHYTDILIPPGWSFAVEEVPMSHAHGVHTPHGEVSPGPCFCQTAGSVHWWTDDPALAVELFIFGYDHSWTPEDVGWDLLTRREGPPPTFHDFHPFWEGAVGGGTGPVHAPYDIVFFTLELDASYEEGILSLDFTLGASEPATWANFLILTYPTIQVIRLWTVPLPVIDPPISFPISFPLPSMGLIGLWTGLFTAEGAQAVELAWVDTLCWDTDGDGYKDETCGGSDCDDSDPAVNPGAVEGPAGDPTCSDGLDNDCDGDLDAADPNCELIGDMVTIPAGEFVMGSDPTDPDSFLDEYPEHVVYLNKRLAILFLSSQKGNEWIKCLKN